MIMLRFAEFGLTLVELESKRMGKTKVDLKESVLTAIR